MMAINNQQVFEFSDISKNCILRKLYTQYLNSEYVDVSLKINAKIISVHGFILAAESDYFKEKLKAQEASSSHIYIDISHVTSNFSYLESIIKYLYKRKIRLNDYNIAGILQICHYCSFKRLILHSKQFLLTRMKPSNCLEIWRIARMLHMCDIEKMALILIQELFWDESLMTSLKFIEDKELSYLMEHAPFPRKVTNAYRFLISWLEEQFSERLADAHTYFSKFIPKLYLEYAIKEMEDESQTKSFLKRVHSGEQRSEIISPFLDENWVVVLKERAVFAVYFPAENRWVKISATLSSKVIGVLGNDIVILDERVPRLNMLNMRSWCSRFIPTPYIVDTLLAFQYFCSNIGLHIAYCTSSGKDIKLQIKNYDITWEISASIVYSDWQGDCKMKIDPDPKNFDTVYILITSSECNDNPLQNVFVLLQYDSLNKQIGVVFESKSWIARVNCIILFLEKGIHIVNENVDNRYIDQLKSGSLTATSILDRTNTIAVNIPIVTYHSPRPDSVTLLKDNLYFVAHFESVHYCSYSSKLFWLEHVAPFITRVFVYDILEENKWVELSPNPLSSVNELTIDVFSRNSVLRGVFISNNEKQPIYSEYYPFINMRIDNWNGIMVPTDLPK